MALGRRFGLFRLTLGVVVAATLLAFAAIQLASDALTSGAAAPGTLPTRVAPSFGVRVYRLLDRIAPASYVESALAMQALSAGETASALKYALRLPASPSRDEILARIAQAEGQTLLAREYFLAAPDPAAVTAQAQALAATDPSGAYALERLLLLRLQRSATHPDAVAQTYWEMGRLANRTAWRQIPGSAVQNAWLRRGLQNFDAAVDLAPLSERYAIEAANQADLLGERARARALFARAAALDPGSADAVAGLGVIAWEEGDRNGAQAYLSRARAIDPDALMVRALERDLRGR